MTYSDIVKRVSQELNLPVELVDKTYRRYWLFIRESIQNLPLKEVDENTFSKLRTNFNIPSLGKLSCTKERWLGVKRRLKYITNLKKRNA